MIYTIGSREITGPVEINANTLTKEENELLYEIFRKGLGHVPNDVIYKGTISLSYNLRRTMTWEEEIEHEKVKIAELMRKAGGVKE